MKISSGFVLVAALVGLAAPRSVTAQEYATDQGSLILGGSAGLTRTSYTNVLEGVEFESHNTYAFLSPSVQYFVVPGLALGGTVSLQHFGFEENSTTAFGAGPIVSYYLSTEDQKLHPYVSGQALLTRSDGENSTMYGGSVGALYMLSRAVGLDAGLFYRRNGFSESDGHSSDFGLALGFSAFTF